MARARRVDRGGDERRRLGRREPLVHRLGGGGASRGPRLLTGLAGARPETADAPAPETDEERNALDVATIQGLRAGELDPNAAWSDLISRHRRRIFSLAYRFTGRYEDAEELTHEIIVRIFHQLDRFDPRAHFAVWLNSVARNHCIDRYRARTRERQRLLPDEAPLERVVASPRQGPDRMLEQRELRDDLAAALDALSPKLREVVQLRFFSELPYEEICVRLGVPEGTVKSRIHRGRAELRRQLAVVRNGRRRRPPAAPAASPAEETHTA